MTEAANCAIHFYQDAFVPNASRVYGRQSAGSGFLQAFARHSDVATLYCCSRDKKSFSLFGQEVKEVNPSAALKWIPYSNLETLRSVGCLYQPDPYIASLAWHRRRLGSDSASLCGVTHTLCTSAIMDALGDLLVAPIEPWDALICTSQCTKAVVEHVLHSWQEYLHDRFGGEAPIQCQLPVIPLGVDCDAFDIKEAKSDLRWKIRQEFGIPADELVVLYVGRLSYAEKAHPVAMYLAIEEVARRTRKRLHLVQFGWFSNPQVQEQFIDGARKICPSVTAHFLSDRSDLTGTIWHAADIFISLSDNVQETFGLTPIEAMAAGLPQVVSDWDGYRETVRHGVDGFRVPTVAPPPGSGHELVTRYSLGIDSYERFVGTASQSIVVDVASCVSALEQLVVNKSLREKMGETAQMRAHDTYDWRIVIAAYQSLWLELAERRTAGQGMTSTTPRPHPLLEDPFTVFAHYASCTLDSNCVLDVGPNASLGRLQLLASMRMNSFAAQLMLDEHEILAIVDLVTAEAPLLTRDLLARIPATKHASTLRTLGWLMKMDAIQVVGLSL